ncbi:MAG: hypothetical protein WC637_23260, partial [Victivallales bacterium]
MYDLPVVETTGYITLSLWDSEKINVRRMEITELDIMKNPACFAIARRATAGYPVKTLSPGGIRLSPVRHCIAKKI